MMLTAAGFRQMTAMLLAVATDVCDGRVAFVHEGGYSEAYVPFCGLAVIEELAGAKTGIEDPYHHLFDGMGGQGLQPHQADAIAAAGRSA
jgi:acetoin utilization deacetylase AcuC-like enzyme